MNRLHGIICSSRRWSRAVQRELPAAGPDRPVIDRGGRSFRWRAQKPPARTAASA